MTLSSCMEMLKGKFEERKNLCIGLDTDFREISDEVKGYLREHFNLAPMGAEGPVIFSFNRAIIDATFDIAACYKINPAFYEASGIQGLWALERTASYLHDMHQSMPWIFDRKYGDVGHASAAGARYAFGVLRAPAVTVNPWGGRADGLDAFLKHEDKGIFVWCKGSNEGSKEFQEIEINHPYPGGGDQSLYELVAENVSGFTEYIGPTPEWGWNERGNCGVVVGATDPEAIRRVRFVVGDMPILIPGIGSQEGDLEQAVKAALYMDFKTGEISLPAIFNVSRSIIFASRAEDFVEAARAKAGELHEAIRKIF